MNEHEEHEELLAKARPCPSEASKIEDPVVRAKVLQVARAARHFIVVLVPMKGGGWRAHFPDFPGCRAEGSRIEGTIDASYAEVVARLARAAEIPAPRNYEDVRADDAWATERGIEWSTAVVSLVRIGKKRAESL